MKTLIPVFLLVPLGLGISATGSDPIGTTLLMYAGSLLLLVLGTGLLFVASGSLLRHVLVYIAAIAILIIVAWTHFPFRLTFSFSKQALQILASRIRAGEHVSFPTRAGLFTVQHGGQRSDGSVYLWTNPHPSGPEGFVSQYNGRSYNLWSELRLADDWHFICED